MEIRRIGVLGAGQMGLGIAQAAARAGFETYMAKATPGPLDAQRGKVEMQLQKDVEKGKLTAADHDDVLDHEHDGADHHHEHIGADHDQQHLHEHVHQHNHVHHVDQHHHDSGADYDHDRDDERDHDDARRVLADRFLLHHERRLLLEQLQAQGPTRPVLQVGGHAKPGKVARGCAPLLPAEGRRDGERPRTGRADGGD